MMMHILWVATMVVAACYIIPTVHAEMIAWQSCDDLINPGFPPSTTSSSSSSSATSSSLPHTTTVNPFHIYNNNNFYHRARTASSLQQAGVLDNNIHCDCANVTVPLSWNISHSYSPQELTQLAQILTSTDAFYSPTITVFIRRAYYMQPTSTSLFLHQGGPGIDDSTFLIFTPNMLNLTKNQVTLYMPDHRGTGASTPLHCPGA